MSRVTGFSSPFLVGFDDFERLLDEVAKSAGDGYPPYNVERVAGDATGKTLCITLAVAGFAREELSITLEENQLTIAGRQPDDGKAEFLHRGIAARHFQRTFVLADGMEVTGASLENGLLSVHLNRPEPERIVKQIAIK